jgi:hypothetical protein
MIGLTRFEREALKELKQTTGKPFKGRNVTYIRKDIVPTPLEGEQMICLPSGTYVCYIEEGK